MTSYRIDATAELVELASELAEVLYIVAHATGNGKAVGFAERAAKRAQTLQEDFEGQTR